MSDLSDLKCAACGEPLERVRYFPRQLLTADDMRAEQEYARERARRHNRFLHGWGIVCGCAVERIAEAKTPSVRVCPGYVLSPQGDEIWIDQCVEVDLTTGPINPPCAVQWPCPPTGQPPQQNPETKRFTVYIAARYAECQARPVRVPPADCLCDASVCEYSRIRDSFEIKVLWQLPDSHFNARRRSETLLQQLKKLMPAMRKHERGMENPPCPECISEPWVVLASVSFIPGAPESTTVSTLDSRFLLATHVLQAATLSVA